MSSLRRALFASALFGLVASAAGCTCGTDDPTDGGKPDAAENPELSFVDPNDGDVFEVVDDVDAVQPGVQVAVRLTATGIDEAVVLERA